MRRAARVAARLVLLGGCVGLLAGTPVTGRAASPTSLPSVPTGVLPGPEVLYAPAPAAPQLENRDARFTAPFVRVSATEVYRGGEYLYTDHLYDDFGSDTAGTGGGSLSPQAGDLSYPADPARYANNAADLFEFRIAPGAEDVAYRISLNTLLVADSTLVAVAFDRDGNTATGSPTLAKDPGAPFPGTDEVLYVWGTGAEWSQWTGAGWSPTALGDVTVDLEANQITVVVPRTVADPEGTWKATLATGLYNPATGSWLPPNGSSTTDPNPPDILNLGFRFDEPVTNDGVPPDTAQAAALRAKNPTKYQRAIDFGALMAKEQRSNVPASGTMVRYFPSRLDLGEGKDFSKFPGYLGQLQPYSIYVPTTYDGAPVGLTLNLHSLSDHHWQYNGSTGVQQLGEQRRNIVATAMARGDDGWYQDEAEYDVFEMWNDIAAHYSLDPDRAAITGYSMGGYATYRLGTLYPDLFGRAMTVVGPPGDGIWLGPTGPPTGGMETLSNLWLENARNLPYINIVSAQDELVPISGTTQQNIGPAINGFTSFDALGYRFRFDVYNPGDHLHLAVLSYNLPQGAEFLGESRVDRNPYHVTYSYMPAADSPKYGLVHDHAYWVSGIRLADLKAGSPLPEATVDVRSHSTGLGVPTSARTAPGAGVTPTPYTSVGRDWSEPPKAPVENKLTVNLTNVGSATFDATRAGFDVANEIVLDVTATHDAVARFTGEGGSVFEVAIKSGKGTYTIPAGALAALASDEHGAAAADDLDGTLPTTGSLPVPMLGLLLAAVAVAVRRASRR